jgi:hypothetical protein
MFKPGELPLFDEIGDVSDVVEGLTKLSIRDSLFFHFKHRDIHDLPDCGMVEPLEFPFAFDSQGPGLRPPEGSVQW